MIGIQVSLERRHGTLRATEQPPFVRNFLFRSGNVSAHGSAGMPGAMGTAAKALASSHGDTSLLEWSAVRMPGAVPDLPKGMVRYKMTPCRRIW